MLQPERVPDLVDGGGEEAFEVAGARTLVGVAGEPHDAADDRVKLAIRPVHRSRRGQGAPSPKQPGRQVVEDHVAAGGVRVLIGILQAAERQVQVGVRDRIPRRDRLLDLAQDRAEAVVGRVNRRALIADEEGDRGAAVGYR